ncbi:MAG TPA: hypothetical protein VFY90_06300 [Tepidiformaceae bacterium]|nr:hypothetical protein [Tepidiformaceae bacterium]
MEPLGSDSLEGWLIQLLRARVPGYGWRELRDGFVPRATETLKHPEVLSQFSSKNQEKLTWNLAFGIGESLHADENGLEAKLALLDSCPGFFARFYGELATYSQSCDMFWDIIISFTPAESHLRAHIFDALTAQLAISNVYCQLSALHGFNHLQDPKCRPVIDAFLATAEDPAVKEYGKIARLFQAM